MKVSLNLKEVKKGQAIKEIASDIKDIRTKGKPSKKFWYKNNDDTQLGKKFGQSPEKIHQPGSEVTNDERIARRYSVYNFRA